MALPVGFYGSLQWIGWLSLLDEVALNHWNTHFEEFCYALNEEIIIDYIKTCFRERKSLEEQLHKKAMLLFKQYMLMGGMPSYSEKINFFNFSE